ncbi:SPW repeat domain-containing protein [Streptomyces beihaiensis]|uniref:SPW repeat protein n=1 Tax=Streptomyces beihaiensis TaxID=2984495 RepID=A0ABT3TWI3_9ACTN|nr:SPW repeat protein [Streptomyces beihaiensis]MCX3060400.1 SPW repeat protein [Streptomyces beihaiensis]
MAERTFPGIAEHPDILALRAHSERATTNVVAQVLEGLGLLAGLYLAASAWIVGFEGSLPTLAVTNLIAGVAYVFFMGGGGFGSAYERTHAMSWAAAGIGVFTIIAPWAVNASRNAHTTAEVVSNVIVGGLAVCFAAGTAVLGMMASRRS